ncbi:hypothetical protein D3C84_193680 [compost metagenome]
MLREILRSIGMSVYEWARQELRDSLVSAQEAGFEPGLSLRALLSAVVQQSKAVRSAEDLADELQFLAENLDDGEDYSFMRP